MATTSTVNRVEPRVRPGISETMLNKVPEVTLHFWVVEVLCTTVGETTADFLNADGLPVLFRRLSEGSAHDCGHGETPPPLLRRFHARWQGASSAPHVRAAEGAATAIDVRGAAAWCTDSQ